MRIALILISALAVFAATLSAGVDKEPADALEDTIHAALEAIYGECCADGSAAEKEAGVRAAVEKNFSFQVVVRRAIGGNWKKMGPEEQVQVVELITQLVVKTLVKSLDGAEQPQVAFGTVVEITDKRIEIPSSVTAGGQTYNVVYRMGRLKSGWEIYDIVAEDISVVSNYRQQFDDHFRSRDGSALIARLEELLENGEIGDDIKI